MDSQGVGTVSQTFGVPGAVKQPALAFLLLPQFLRYTQEGREVCELRLLAFQVFQLSLATDDLSSSGTSFPLRPFCHLNISPCSVLSDSTPHGLCLVKTPPRLRCHPLVLHPLQSTTPLRSPSPSDFEYKWGVCLSR
jgi:hypothetical protein